MEQNGSTIILIPIMWYFCTYDDQESRSTTSIPIHQAESLPAFGHSIVNALLHVLPQNSAGLSPSFSAKSSLTGAGQPIMKAVQGQSIWFD